MDLGLIGVLRRWRLPELPKLPLRVRLELEEVRPKLVAPRSELPRLLLCSSCTASARSRESKGLTSSGCLASILSLASSSVAAPARHLANSLSCSCRSLGVASPFISGWDSSGVAEPRWDPRRAIARGRLFASMAAQAVSR